MIEHDAVHAAETAIISKYDAWRARLENIRADAVAEKSDLVGKMKALRVEAAGIDNERKQIDYSLHRAEQQLAMNRASTRAGYVSARATMASEILLGRTDAKLDEIPAADPVAAMSAADLNAGIEALKGKREQLAFSYRQIQGKHNDLKQRYCEAHAKISGVDFLFAREALLSAWVEIVGADNVNGTASLYGNRVFSGNDFLTDISIPSPTAGEKMADLTSWEAKFGNNAVTAAQLRNGGLISGAEKRLVDEMEGR